MSVSLFATLSCVPYRAREERKRNEYFAEILKRVDRHRIGDDRFFEDNLLGNPDPTVRQWCALALARIGSVRALPLLYSAAHTGDAAVRAASAFAIGGIKDRDLLGATPDPEAVRQVAGLLGDSSISVQMRAVEALGKIGSHPEAAEIARRLENGGPRIGSPAEIAYIGSAITALVRLKDPLAFPALERLAQSKNPEVRLRALDGLAHLRDEKASSKNLESSGPDRDVALAGLLDKSSNPAALQEPGPSAASLTETVCLTLTASRKNSTIAIVKTTRGTLEIELFREEAPLTVADFVLMARKGEFDGFAFEQVIPSQRIGAKGSELQTGSGRIANGEINLRPFERGSLGAVPAGGRYKAGRFFIALAPQPYLDGVDTCFGRVISGMQAADRIVPGDKILHVDIKETISFMDHVRY